jgi:hypothetical protein
MIVILFIAFSICNGFTEYQNTIVRQQSINHRAPQSSSIVDALLPRDYAFTDQQLLISSIDGLRFQCCPNSFTNVMAHEIHHLNGRQHNTVYVKDDPMSYAITIRQDGSVIEDSFILPPLSPSQPWAAQILAPSPTMMRPVPIRNKPLSMPYMVLIPRNKSLTLSDLPGSTSFVNATNFSNASGGT